MRRGLSALVLASGFVVLAGCERDFDDSGEPDVTPAPGACESGAVRCSGTERQLCGDDGAWTAIEDCGGARLVCEQAACVCPQEDTPVCNGGAVERCVQGQYDTQACDGATPACFGGQCTACVPDVLRCGDAGPEQCSADGMAWEAQAPCGPDATCVDGACQGVGRITVLASELDRLAGWTPRGETAQGLYFDEGRLFLEAAPAWPHAVLYRSEPAVLDGEAELTFQGDGGGFQEAMLWLRLRSEPAAVGEAERLSGYVANVSAWNGTVSLYRVEDDAFTLLAASEVGGERALPNTPAHRLVFSVRGGQPAELSAALFAVDEDAPLVEAQADDDAAAAGLNGAGGIGFGGDFDRFGSRMAFDAIALRVPSTTEGVREDTQGPALLGLARSSDPRVAWLHWDEQRSLPLQGAPDQGVIIAIAGGGVVRPERATWTGATRAELRFASDLPSEPLTVTYAPAAGEIADAAGNAAQAAAGRAELEVDLAPPVGNRAQLLGGGVIELTVDDASLPLRTTWNAGDTGSAEDFVLTIPGTGAVTLQALAPARRRPEVLRLFVEPGQPGALDGAQLTLGAPASGVSDRAGNLLAAGSWTVAVAEPLFVEDFRLLRAFDSWRGATSIFAGAGGGLFGRPLTDAPGGLESRLVEPPVDAMRDGTLRADFRFEAGDGDRGMAVCGRLQGPSEAATGICVGVLDVAAPDDVAFSLYTIRDGALGDILAEERLGPAGVSAPDFAELELALQLEADSVRGVLVVPAEVVGDNSLAQPLDDGRFRIWREVWLDVSDERVVPVREGRVALGRGDRALRITRVEVLPGSCAFSARPYPATSPELCPVDP